MKRLKIFMAISFIALLGGLQSCYTKQDTIAIIKVKDEAGILTPNANVRIYGSGTSGTVVANYTGTTNSSGEAIFNLNNMYQSGQAGVAVLDIEVTKGADVSYGIIKVEQEKTTTKVVVIGN